MMDWIFHYTLSKKIPYNDVVNSSDIQFIKDSQNYLEGFDIQVNDVDFAEAELNSMKKSNNLKKILIVKSGMETDILLSGYDGIPKVGGFRQVGNILRSSYNIEGKINKLDLLDSHIHKLIENEDHKLIYLSSAVSHKYNGRPIESITVGFKVVEKRDDLCNYSKYSCIRNILSHKGPDYSDATVTNFDNNFGQTNTFDLKQYDVNNKIIVLDLESAKTRIALDKLAGDLIQDARTVLNL